MPPPRRRLLTRRRLAIATILLVALPLAAWFVGRRMLAHWAMVRALAAAGVEHASFDITHLGTTSLRVENLAAGTDPWLTAGRIDVVFSPGGLLRAHVDSIVAHDVAWTIRIRNGQIDWGPTRNQTPGPVSLPFDRLELAPLSVRLVTEGGTVNLPVRLSLQAQAAGASAATAADISLDSATPATFAFDQAGVSGTVGSVTGSLKIVLSAAGVQDAHGTLVVRNATVQAGDAALTGVDAEIALRSPHELAVTRLAGTVGDGGSVAIEPFAIDPAHPAISTRLALDNLSLAEWLPLLTSHHAAGEGRMGGTVSLALSWTDGQLAVTALTGSLHADPMHGFIQVADADALGSLLDAQDPRFTTDEVMQPVRDKIVDAFRDFAFQKLTLDLARQEDHTVATAYISGYGRHGEDPQGLNITLDLHVHDALVGLASRLASLSRIKAGAQTALDRFFQPATPGTGDPRR